MIKKLEPVCCKKRQKSPNQENGLWNTGHLNDTKLVLNEHQRVTHLNLASFRASKGPLFPRPVSWLGLCFTVSYSRPGLHQFKFFSTNVQLYMHISSFSVTFSLKKAKVSQNPKRRQKWVIKIHGQ